MNLFATIVQMIKILNGIYIYDKVISMKIGDFEFLIGADPECFIIEKATGKLVSAHGMLPGDKDNPYPVKHGAIQVDGMAAEFNIDPAATEDEFVRNVKDVLDQIRLHLGVKYDLVFIPTAHFGKALIDAQPMEAKILGCDPDFNAYTHKQNPMPNVETPYRTGAGHIHIGWTNGVDISNKQHLGMCEHLIRNLDHYSMWTMLHDEDTTRRMLYGKAGAYRPKSYGVEYRTPSNFWLSDEKYMRQMYRTVMFTILKAVGGSAYVKPKEDCLMVYQQRVDYVFNNRDFDSYWDEDDLSSQIRTINMWGIKNV